MGHTVSASSASSSATAVSTRLAGLREWMGKHDLEAAYVTRPVSIAYLTGFAANPHERLMALAVSQEGATLIVPALERDNAVRNADGAQVVAWRDGEDAYELV